MSALDKLKENKKLVIIAGGAIVIIIAFLVFVLPNSGQREEEARTEVISKRVKIDVKPLSAPAAPQSAVAPAAAPAMKPPAAQKPAPLSPPPSPLTPLAKAQAEPAKKEAAPAQAAKAEPEKPKKIKKADVSKKPWALNVSSFISDNEALSLKKKLKASGYNAYVSKIEKDGMTWYRVRVGFYRTRAEAKKAGRKIVARFKIDHEPWILKPAKAELAERSR